jgi:hypothetical protein
MSIPRDFEVVAVTFGLLFFVVSCATHAPAARVSSQVGEASRGNEPPAVPAANKVDTIQDAWAKQRAAYLRSLDFEKVDLQKNHSATYTIKSDIIDSRYHIRNSETDLTVDHNRRSALRELRLAKQSFERAVTNANSKELHLLGGSKSMLNDLIKQSELSMQNKCDTPDHSDYHLLEGKLEDLLATL